MSQDLRSIDKVVYVARGPAVCRALFNLRKNDHVENLAPYRTSPPGPLQPAPHWHPCRRRGESVNGPGPVPDVVTGAAMDTRLVRPRWRRLRIGVFVGVALVSFAWLLWQLLPHGLSVSPADLRIGTVERSIFHDDVSVLASARPLRSVVLDSIEQGRVEEVFVQDGALVKKGQLLFRLSNTQRLLELVARQSDRGLNVANLSSLRLQVQTTRADHDRRMLDLEFALAAAKRQLERDTALARQGFIAPSVLDASRDLAAKAQRAVREELTSNASAEKITNQSLEQMDQAMATIDSGLGLLANAVRALAV